MRRDLEMSVDRKNRLFYDNEVKVLSKLIQQQDTEVSSTNRSSVHKTKRSFLLFTHSRVSRQKGSTET